MGGIFELLLLALAVMTLAVVVFGSMTPNVLSKYNPCNPLAVGPTIGRLLVGLGIITISLLSLLRVSYNYN